MMAQDEHDHHHHSAELSEPEDPELAKLKELFARGLANKKPETKYWAGGGRRAAGSTRSPRW
jgi:hypothetical protein